MDRHITATGHGDGTGPIITAIGDRITGAPVGDGTGQVYGMDTMAGGTVPGILQMSTIAIQAVHSIMDTALQTVST